MGAVIGCMACPPEAETVSMRRGVGKGSSTSAKVGRRDWSGLPAPVLFTIAMSLSTTGSHLDVLRFGCVCKAWRSVATDSRRAVLLASSLPPLLFRDATADLYCPANGRVYKNGRLTALLRGGHEGRRFRAVGFSFGHIIAIDHSDAKPFCRGPFLIVNPFTVACTRTRQSPPPECLIGWAALPSPPTSLDSVVLSYDSHAQQLCHLRDDRRYIFPSVRYGSRPPVLFGDKVYIINSLGHLEAFDVNERYITQAGLRTLPIRGLSRLAPSALLRLCASDAELLLVRVVLFRRSPRDRPCVFEVYRIDLTGGCLVRLDSLGDRALFLDRYNATLSESPGRWGGRGNCIYYVDLYDGSPSVFHLQEDAKTEHRPARCSDVEMFPPESPSLWILPSMCY